MTDLSPETSGRLRSLFLAELETPGPIRFVVADDFVPKFERPEGNSDLDANRVERLENYRKMIGRKKRVGGDRSSTGLGKTWTTIAVSAEVAKSLHVVPTHALAEELVEDMRRAGIEDVAAYGRNFDGGPRHGRRAKSGVNYFSAEVKLLAERRAGEVLRQMAESGERARGRKPKSDTMLDLKDIGFSHAQSSRFQQAASVPDEDFLNWRRIARPTSRLVVALDGVLYAGGDRGGGWNETKDRRRHYWRIWQTCRSRQNRASGGGSRDRFRDADLTTSGSKRKSPKESDRGDELPPWPNGVPSMANGSKLEQCPACDKPAGRVQSPQRIESASLPLKVRYYRCKDCGHRFLELPSWPIVGSRQHL